jgi:hypothetical protein
MSRFRGSLGLAICLIGMGICGSAHAATYTYTFNAVTYTVVEPDPFLSGGSAGNTVNMNNPGQFWAQNVGGNQNGLYSWRNFGTYNLNAPKPAGDPDLFEIGGQTVAPPDLRTTITGLPSATYDVYLAFTVEPFVPSNPVAPATLAADLDVGQASPKTLRGGRSQPGNIQTGYTGDGNPVQYELALAPLGTVTGTTIKVLVGPGWAGDLNRDYMNNQDDLNLVLAHFGQTVAPGDRSVGNTNDDTIINQADLNNVYYEVWGSKGYPPGRRGDYIGVAYVAHSLGAGSGVPEPASIVLLALGALGLSACRRRSRKFIAAALAIILAANSLPTASAAINGWFSQLSTEGDSTPPAGFVSQDLMVNATTDWLSTQMRVVLTSGTIYQDTGAGTPVPGYKGPDPTNFPFLPTLRWDTYVTGSGGLAEAFPLSAGGAIDIGGITGFPNGGSFNTTSINLQWFTTSSADVGTFKLGRFTLADSAQGTWQMRLDSLGQAAPVVLSGNVQNGLLMGTNPPGTAGDFNSDGKVDAADYVTWRKSNNTNNALPNDNGLSTPIGAAHYNLWRANFGAGAGSGSGLVGASNVPEPATIVMLVLACVPWVASPRSLRR